MYHIRAPLTYCTLPQPGNVLLKSTRQDRRGFTVRIVDFGFSTMRGVIGRCPARRLAEGSGRALGCLGLQGPTWGVLGSCRCLAAWGDFFFGRPALRVAIGQVFISSPSHV